MEYYSAEYNLENLGEVNIFNEICSNLYFFYISCKYKNKFNFLENILSVEFEKAKEETSKVLKGKFTEDDFTTTKLNFSILNSLYLHYYRLSFNEGKLSFNARNKWIINTLISDIDKQTSSYIKYSLVLEFKKNLTKSLKYKDLISSYMTCKKKSHIIKEHVKWIRLIENLKKDSIIDISNHWIGLGPGFSKPKTQVTVLIFILEKNKYFNTTNQKEINKEIWDFFKVYYSDSYYSSIKKTLNDPMGIEPSNQYFNIYIKLESYL